MAIRYRCKNCENVQDSLPQDDTCPVCKTGQLVPFDTSAEVAGAATVRPVRREQETSETDLIKGLCVLVCDASISMDNPAFPQETDLTKLKMVTDAIQGAINEMSTLTMAKNAYIAIIAFGKRASLIRDQQGNPFVKSVSSILKEYGGKIGDDLYTQFANDAANIDRDGTNITAALQLARQITDAALSGSLSAWGINTPVTIMPHSVYGNVW